MATRTLSNGARLELVGKLDGWVDTLTGLGDPNRDKRLAGAAYPNVPILSYSQLTDLYRSSDIAAKIIEKPVEEMFRTGYDVLVNGEKGEELQDRLVARGALMDIDANLEDVERWARAFGGGLLVCGLDDGQEMSLPLDPQRLKDITYLTPLNRFEVLPFTYYRDPFALNYGKPETFLINSPEAGFVSDAQLFSIPFAVREALYSSKELTLTPEQKRAAGLTQTTSLWNRVVHETRCIRLNGVRTTRFIERAQQGWGDSVLVRVWETARDFERVHQAVAAILTDFAQGKWKIKGLTDILASPNGATMLQKRMAAVDMSRSVLRSVLLDADGEDFERGATPLAGIPDLLDRFTNRLAAAVDIPVTVLMGEAPAGLNATGDSDIRNWYDRIAHKQKTRLAPAYERFYRWLTILEGEDPEGIEVQFRPLYQPTDEERSKTRFQVAQADAAYIDRGVLTPVQVARARFGGTEYSMDVALDPEELDGMEKMQDEQQAMELEGQQAQVEATKAQADKTTAEAETTRNPPTASIEPSLTPSKQDKRNETARRYTYPGGAPTEKGKKGSVG